MYLLIQALMGVFTSGRPEQQNPLVGAKINVGKNTSKKGWKRGQDIYYTGLNAAFEKQINKQK